MKFNQKLILGLSFGYLVFSTFFDDKVAYNYNQSSIESVITLNGGAQSPSPQDTTNIPIPQQQGVKGSKNSRSSVSNSNSNPQPGNNIKYFPNGDPGGSGGSSNTEYMKWETKASYPNPDEIISNADFWNYYLESNDLCPIVDVELDEDDDWSFKNIVEIPEEVLSQQRRRLLATPLQPS